MPCSWRKADKMESLITAILCGCMLQLIPGIPGTQAGFLYSVNTCPQQLLDIGCQCHTLAGMTIFCKDLDLEHWPRFNELPAMGVVTLDLSGNSFDHFPVNAFGNLRIRHLLFSNNERLFGNEIADPGDFENIFNNQQTSSLLSLDISNNNIETFPNFLNQLTNLETLNLIGNDIDVIPRTALSGASHLRELHLGQTVEIETSFFDNLPELKVFEVSPHRPHTFTWFHDFLGPQNTNPLQNVETLIVKDATVSFGLGLLENFPRLTHLELVRCSLRDLELMFMKVPAGGSRLRYLALPHNDINFMPLDFISLFPQLETLDLSHNHIRTAYGRLQDSNPSLAYVDLSHNVIDHVNHHTFSNLTRLHTLDLSHNQLRHLPESALPQNSADLLLYLGSNDLWCDCDNHWLVRVSHEQHLGLPGPLDIYEVENSLYCPGDSDTPMYSLYDRVLVMCDLGRKF